MYKTNHFSRSCDGEWEHRVEVVAKNGKQVAVCKTESMAQKIVKGLALYEAEEKRKKEFRL